MDVQWQNIAGMITVRVDKSLLTDRTEAGTQAAMGGQEVVLSGIPEGKL